MANREELKEKYGNEEVLVVPLAVIQELGLDVEGYNPKTLEEMETIISKLEEASYFIPRWKSDDNPEEVELIAYISFGNPDMLFTYKRVKNGDARGNGKWSVGIGGHINPCDSKDLIYGSAIREIQEEVGVEVDLCELEPQGFIRCKQSAFDLDHLGIHINVDFGIATVEEEDKMYAIGMINTPALKELFYDQLENWTKIIIDHAGGEQNE
jgi:predicted NUDIX family phosphoesterase